MCRGTRRRRVPSVRTTTPPWTDPRGWAGPMPNTQSAALPNDPPIPSGLPDYLSNGDLIDFSDYATFTPSPFEQAAKPTTSTTFSRNVAATTTRSTELVRSNPDIQDPAFKAAQRKYALLTHKIRIFNFLRRTKYGASGYYMQEGFHDNLPTDIVYLFTHMFRGTNIDMDDVNRADELRPRATKFRFKSHKNGSQPSDADPQSSRKRKAPNDANENYDNHHDYPKRVHRTGPAPEDDDPFDINMPKYHDVAFRESLFDALADAEGAAYWAGVYGQPIHTFPRQTIFDHTTGVRRPMTDEEYVAHVQQEMWARTSAGRQAHKAAIAREARIAAMAEQARRNRRRIAAEAEQRAREQARRREQNATFRVFMANLERERCAKDVRLQTQAAFPRYDAALTALTKVKGAVTTTDAAGIPWPTLSGRRDELNEKDLRLFFVRGLELQGVGPAVFNQRLKEHRVRWHPDKMQQKLGGENKVEKGDMEAITMIFRVIDTLWNETRNQG